MRNFRDVISVQLLAGALSACGGGEAVSPTAPSPSTTPLIDVTPANVSLSVVEGISAERTLTMENTGTGSLNWSASNDAAWLSLSPTSGVLTSGQRAALTLTVDAALLSAIRSLYQTEITITGASPTTPPFRLPIAVEVTASAFRLVRIRSSGGRVAWYRGSTHQLIAFDAVVNPLTRDTALFVMEPDGAGLFRVTGSQSVIPTGFVGQPAWHPDGEHILIQVENSSSRHTRFEHMSFGFNNDLWIIRRDGTGAEQIYVSPANHAVLHPHLNADGTRIVFAERIATRDVEFPLGSTPGGENPWAGWQIHVADFDINRVGTEKLRNHRVLFGGGEPRDRGFYETHGFKDDATIVYSHTPDALSYVDDIYTANLDGSGVINLIQSPQTWDEHGQFSPSGNSMTFISSRADPSWVAPVSDASTLRTELFIQKGTDIMLLTDFNNPIRGVGRSLVSDYDWDRAGRRIVFQLAPVGGLRGLLSSVEMWMILFPSAE